jgi:2,3-dihydroxybenzoate-AMP ligase
MSMEALNAILAEMGVDRREISADSHLRTDLGLDSTETTQLELELTRRCSTTVNLWDARDYTLGELAALIDAGGVA